MLSSNRTAGLQVPTSLAAFQNADKLPNGKPQVPLLQNARAGLCYAQDIKLLNDRDQYIFVPLPPELPPCCLGLFKDSRGSAEAWRNSQLPSSRCLEQRDV